MMQYSNPYSFEKTDVRGQKINKILHLTDEAKKRSLVITFQNLVGTFQAMFFSLCYRQLILRYEKSIFSNSRNTKPS